MNNINNSDHIKNNKKSSSRRKLGYALMLTGLLSSSSPAEAKTWNSIDNNEQSVEVVDNSNILNNIERRTWITLPEEYANTLKSFVATNKVMKSNIWAKFTENFIVNQMRFNWWISKKNQLVFVWSAVYKQITNNDLYDWSDWDDNRLDEFSNIIDNIEQCWNEYVTWFNSYMERTSAEAQQRLSEAQKRSADADRRSAEAQKRSADADRRSAEAQKRSADADRRSAEAQKEIIKTTHNRLNQLIEFYDLYKSDPNSIKKENLDRMIKNAKDVIQISKQYGIDYKAKLPIEVRRFYGID